MATGRATNTQGCPSDKIDELLQKFEDVNVQISEIKSNACILPELKTQLDNIQSCILGPHVVPVIRLSHLMQHDVRASLSSGELSCGSTMSISSDILPTSDIDAHKEVLRDEHKHLMDIDLGSTNILDQLVQNKVLQSSEAEAIRNTKSSVGVEDIRVSQTRALLFRLQSRDMHDFRHFIDSLHNEGYRPLAKRLLDAFDSKLQERHVEDDDVKCIVCRIKNNVRVCEIIDTFYEKNMIDAVVAESILSCDNHATQWTRFFQHTRANPFSFDCMMETLGEHHSDLAKEMAKIRRTTFTCFCKHLKEKLKRKQFGVKCSYDSPMESNSSEELGPVSFRKGKKHRPESDYLTVYDVVDDVQQTGSRDTGAAKDHDSLNPEKLLKGINRSDVKRTAFKEKTYDNIKSNP